MRYTREELADRNSSEVYRAVEDIALNDKDEAYFKLINNGDVEETYILKLTVVDKMATFDIYRKTECYPQHIGRYTGMGLSLIRFAVKIMKVLEQYYGEDMTLFYGYGAE